MTKVQLVLASTSPFRRELLSKLGLPFVTVNPATDESVVHGETPETTALRLSEAKARAVASQYPDALIIGSDQMAFIDDQVFGKPGTHDNAVKQLKTMRGRTVNFFTGLCLLNTQTGRAQLRGVPMLVTFRNLSDDEIENYLQKEKPRIERNWLFWQHNERGQVNGIRSYVDFNVYNGDSISFEKLKLK